MSPSLRPPDPRNGLLTDAQHLTSAAWTRGARVRALKRLDAEFVLSRNHVGRVAFHGDGRIELLPIHYVYSDGAIVGRTSLGAKYVAWLTRDDVVFEVDESEGLFDWRSVVVRGRVRILRARGTEPEVRAYEAAASLIRSLIPAAFTPHDPAPYRGFVFAIACSEITGREASAR